VPRLLTPLYNKIQTDREAIGAYVRASGFLSTLEESELARSLLSIFFQCGLLLIPLFFYKKGEIKVHILKMKSVGTMDIPGLLLFAAILIATIGHIMISYTFIPAQDFLAFNLNLENLIFWVRYIFILCLLAPLCEELFFRGIILNELKECFNMSARIMIFLQALLFFLMHFLLSGGMPFIIFLIGIATGILAYYTQSLLYCFVFHACYNSFVLLCQTGLINAAGYLILPDISRALLAVLILVIAAICFVLFKDHMKKRLVFAETR
jgi:membrane protease YdiL (CAAX protease family)